MAINYDVNRELVGRLGNLEEKKNGKESIE